MKKPASAMGQGASSLLYRKTRPHSYSQGVAGGYTIVREYVAQATLRAREMFVPLSHRPGHAQADFGQADGYIAGKKVRFHYFCVVAMPRFAILEDADEFVLGAIE